MEIKIYWNKYRDMALNTQGSCLVFSLLLSALQLAVSIYKSQCNNSEPFKLSCCTVLTISISLKKKKKFHMHPRVSEPPLVHLCVHHLLHSYFNVLIVAVNNSTKNNGQNTHRNTNL